MSNDEWFVTMPKLGETVTEGELTNWLKKVGDTVAFDDPLFEVSTDKVDSEIPSPYDGVIAEILVPAGETVPVGTQLVRIVPPGGVVREAPHGEPAAVGDASPGRRRRPGARRPGGAADGRLRGPVRRGHRPRRAGRRRPRHHHAEARRDRHRGHHQFLAEEGRRHRRVRRPAVRGVHRQGGFRDPQPVRRGAARDPGGRRRHRAGRHRRWPGSARPARPAAAPAAAPRRRRLRAAAPAAAAGGERRNQFGGGAGADAVAAGPPARRRERAGRRVDPRHRGRRPDPAGGRAEGARQRRHPHGAGPAAHRRAAAPARARAGRRCGEAGRQGAPCRPACPTRATRSSRCPGCGSRWPAA